MIQHMHQPRALDRQPVRQFRLRQARIGADHHDHRILRRPQVDRRQCLDEILEHPHLRAAQEIAKMLRQHIEIDLAPVAPPRLRCSNGRARQGAALNGALGHDLLLPPGLKY